MYEPRLAAVFSGSSRKDKTNSGVLTKHNRSVTSPHTVMGRLFKSLYGLQLFFVGM